MSESTNSTPNTSQVSEPVVATGGSGPVSWDELESVTKFQKELKKREIKEEKEAENEVTKPAKKESKKKEESEEEGGDDEHSQNKIPGDKKNEKESSKEKEKSASKKEQISKKLKVKDGEAELELASDLKVPVKIDGKTTEVTLQEALSRYSQQAHLDKIYRDFKTESQKFETDRKAVSEAINKAYDYLVNKNDLRGFFDFMGEALGENPQQLYNDAMEKVAKQFEELQGLSSEERKLKEIEQENSYWRQKHESQLETQKREKQKLELETRAKEILQSNGMEPEQLVQAYDELKSLGYSDDDLTVDYIAAYHVNRKKIDFIESTLRAIDEEAATDSNIEKFAEEALTLKLTDEEIKEALQAVFGNSPEKKLARKYDQMKKANRTPGPKNPMKDPLFFGDL